VQAAIAGEQLPLDLTLGEEVDAADRRLLVASA
jgi:hypothetical protein